MKTYLILTRSITGLSGNPRYVNNKCKYLKQIGWNPVVIWNYNLGKIELEHVMPFENNVLHELQFFPCWYSDKDQNIILKKIIDIVGVVDEIVIESNKLQLAAWGELLAERYKAKHIVFVTSEGIRLENKSSFDFFYTKLLREEFFTINEGSVKKLFEKYTQIDEPKKYCWAAAPGVEVHDISFPSFEQMPKSDYVISHFGRYKPYFPKMLEEIKLFIAQHLSCSFNLFFLGDISKSECNLEQTFAGLNNVNLVIHPPMPIIPNVFFSCSDLIIATAGCASIARQNRAKVISMDVQTMNPLGLLGYTTLDTNIDSQCYKNNLSLSEWLNSILIEKKEYEEIPYMANKRYFDSQLPYFDKKNFLYVKCDEVEEVITKYDKILKFISRLGFYKLVNFIYYSKRRIKVSVPK